MATEASALRERIRGLADPQAVATALVNWMIDDELDVGLIDRERSREHPTLSASAVDQLPMSLTLQLARVAPGAWAVGDSKPTVEARLQVREDGAVIMWAPASREWELHTRSVKHMLLDDVLHWIRLYSPAARAFRFGAGTGPLIPPQAELVHESINHRIDQVVFTWYATDNALVFAIEGRSGYLGRPAEIEVLGRRRAEIESVQPPHAEQAEWVSVEHAMEPHTDHRRSWHGRFPGIASPNGRHDLIADVAEQPPVTAFKNFLRVWYGINGTAGAAQDLPTALALALSAGGDLFRDAHLGDPRAEPKFDGPENAFLAECQYLWQAGYEHRDSDDPAVLLTIDDDRDRMRIQEFTVAQMLLRVLVDEATFHSPVTGTARWVDPALLASAIGDMRPFAELPGFASPALTDGRVVVVTDSGWRGNPLRSIRFAAHARDHIVSSPIGDLPRLEWSYS